MIELGNYEFGIAIGAMFETFGQESTDQILLGYWMGLSDLELSDVQRSIARAIRECDKLPKPVELRRLAGESTDEQAATIAWDDALRGVSLGPYKHVDFSNRTINAVIRNLGGWNNFVSRFTDAEAEKWLRQEFIRAYRNLSTARLSDEALAPLPGLATGELVNGVLGDPQVRSIACASSQVTTKRIGVSNA